MKVRLCFTYSYLQLVLKEVFHSHHQAVRVYLVIPEDLSFPGNGYSGETHKRFNLSTAPEMQV